MSLRPHQPQSLSLPRLVFINLLFVLFHLNLLSVPRPLRPTTSTSLLFFVLSTLPLFKRGGQLNSSKDELSTYPLQGSNHHVVLLCLLLPLCHSSSLIVFLVTSSFPSSYLLLLLRLPRRHSSSSSSHHLPPFVFNVSSYVPFAGIKPPRSSSSLSLIVFFLVTSSSSSIRLLPCHIFFLLLVDTHLLPRHIIFLFCLQGLFLFERQLDPSEDELLTCHLQGSSRHVVLPLRHLLPLRHSSSSSSSHCLPRPFVFFFVTTSSSSSSSSSSLIFLNKRKSFLNLSLGRFFTSLGGV